MKTEFTEDLENKQLIAKRTLDAPIENVWKAWSNPDLLCQWWAPKPYICQIDHMDFKVGGYWMYVMIGPEGDQHRGRMDFIDIKEHSLIEGEDFFCDENGKPAGGLDPMHMRAVFTSDGNSTTIISTTTFGSVETMKEMAKMGMVEGWDMAMNQLEELVG